MDKALPGTKIVDVTTFMIRGSGRLDDIQLSKDAPPPPGGLGQKTVLRDPSTGTVSGYRIYFGTSPSESVVKLDEVMASEPGFDPAAPAVTYDVSNDLGLSAGDTACFRVQASNSSGSSAQLDAACTSI